MDNLKGFSFIPKNHQYLYNGIRIPSVTQVLNEWVEISFLGKFSILYEIKKYHVHTVSGAVVSAKDFEYAGDRGKAVHDGCRLILDGNLDWEVLDPVLLPPLRQFEAWKKKEKVHLGVDTQCEVAMMSERYQFAGRPDLITPIKGVMSIIEIKTGTWGQVAAQLAAYEQLYREHTRYKKTMNWYVLDLSGKKYNFRQIRDVQAWPFFLNSLGRYKYLTAQQKRR